MYLARFSYDVMPVNRQKAMDFISDEVAAARRENLPARLLVPLTRGDGGHSLQFEVELNSLDQLDKLRHRRPDPNKPQGEWMHDFSAILMAPPSVEILRIDGVAEG